MKKKNISYVVLHNVRSTHNVGAIFRVADAIGIDTIYLSGYSPTPRDRFGRMRSDLHKTALGAEKNVSWEHVSNIGSLLRRLKKDNVVVVAVEQGKGATDYKKFKTPEKSAFVFGNEVRGLSQALLEMCDHTIFIPMHGKKESLNVATTAGIILYRALDR